MSAGSGTGWTSLTRPDEREPSWRVLVGKRGRGAPSLPTCQRARGRQARPGARCAVRAHRLDPLARPRLLGPRLARRLRLRHRGRPRPRPRSRRLRRLGRPRSRGPLRPLPRLSRLRRLRRLRRRPSGPRRPRLLLGLGRRCRLARLAGPGRRSPLLRRLPRRGRRPPWPLRGAPH